MKTVFEFDSYLDFLRDYADSRGGRGAQAEFAEVAGCHSGYLTRVFSGRAQLSLEQAEKIADFLGLSPEQTIYFLQLVNLARAGTPALRKILRQELERRKREALQISKNIKLGQELSAADQTIYYSAWYYAAIHMLVTIPEFRTKDMIKKKLRITEARVTEVLQFLLRTGLVEQVGAQFQTGRAAMHLDEISPMKTRLHSNWRLRAIEALDRRDSKDLHYSGVATLSRADVEKVRLVLIEGLQKSVQLIQKSREEEIYCLNIDFFSV